MDLDVFAEIWHSREVPKNLLVDLQKNCTLPGITISNALNTLLSNPNASFFFLFFFN